MKKLLLFLTLTLAMIWSSDVYATHLMGADLTYTIVGPHQYIVSLSVYRDCNSPIVQPTSYRIFYQSAACNDTGSFVVSVASGYPVNATDTCPSQHSTCDGGTVYGIQQWVYTSSVVNLPANCSDVVLSWASGNRNAVISNLTNPLNDAMYISAEVNTSLIDNSPQFLNPLTVNLCLGQLNYINQGGYDSNGDSLVYVLDTAQGTTGGGPGGYPYYPSNLGYTGGYTPTDPITNSLFNFDPSTGQITVLPTQSEYDVVKLVVYEYRNGVLIGHVERDMQIEISNCTDTLPTLSGISGPGSTDTVFTMSPCTSSCFTIYSSALDTSKTLTLSVTGQTAFPGATFTISSGKDPSLTFCWSPTRANAGIFNFTVTVKDNNCPSPGHNTKNYKVIVPEIFPAGPDQTICQYNTVNAQGNSSTPGRWTAMGTNPIATTIANPTSPTTLITGFSVAGRYNYIWISDTTCIDTMSVFVTSKPNAGPDHTICQFNVATMAATGTGIWHALPTNPRPTTITDTTSTTTTITGFSQLGTYSYVWTSNGCSDTTNVIVTTKPSAGPDQIICSNTGTVTMAATGTGIWTASAGNPSTSVITNPNVATTTITGLLTAGIYTYYWGSGCVDTVQISVVTQPNGGPNQVICQYNTVIMGAVGAGTWSSIPSNPAVTNIVNPTSDSTVITGFTAAGTYDFLWSIGTGCVDLVTVSVTPKPNAGPGQSSCINSTAVMAATGAGTWSAVASNPGSSVIVTPTSPTTTISGFAVAGTYAYVWTSNGCTDTADVIVYTKPNAGPDQTICQQVSTNMAATGTGTWSSSSSDPAVVTFANTADSITLVSGFTAPGTYTLVWTANGCSDTVLIHVTAKPNAGPDQATCQYSTVTMAATGSGTWTALGTNPAATVIVTPGSPTTVIRGFTVAGTYGYVWTLNGCSDTADVVVTAKPNAGPDQNLCAPGTITTAASGGVGVWSIQPTNPGITTITNINNAVTTITGFLAGGTYTYIWTVNGCTDTMNVLVTPPNSAGPDQTICQYNTVTTAAIGVGSWSILSTNPAVTTIANLTADTTTIRGFTLPGSYGYVWSSSICTDTMIVTVTAKPNAGPDQTICQYSTATMAATGTGTWTALGTNPAVTNIIAPASPTTVITGFTAAGTYVYIWSANGCTDTANVIVTPKPNAGPDQTICQYTTTSLAATGTGTWTAAAGNPAVVTFTNATSPTTSVSGFSASGTYTLLWSSNGCSDTVLIHVTAKPNAGPDQTTCQFSTATMVATGTGTWTALGTNPAVTNIITPASPTTVITGFTAAGTYGFVWTLNGCSDTANVIVTPKPNAGPDQTICQYTTTSLAATGTGTWTVSAGNPAVVTLINATSPATSVSGFVTAGTYTFYWSSNGCSDTMQINVTAKPNAGPDQTTCQFSTATMAATGTGTWSALGTNPAVAVITSPTSPTTMISGFTVAGTYGFVWTLNGCSDTANVIVTPKPNAGPDQTTCQFSTATMAGTGTGTWTSLVTNPAATVITNPTSPTTTISGFTVAGTYSYVWTSNGCSDTANVIVTAKPNAGPDQTTCQFSTVTMGGTGTGTWTAAAGNPAATVIVTPASPTTVIRGFTVAGTYNYIWTSNGCSDTASVTVTAKPNAGPDQTTCQFSTVTMAGTGTGTWTSLVTNPAATVITNPTSPTTTISGFTVAGTYSYVWTANGCSDTANVTVTAKPNAGPDQTTCQFSTVTMGGTGTGTWTAAAGNPAATVIVTPASPTTVIRGFTVAGTYNYIWTSNGCSDTASVTVTAKPNAGPDQTTCLFSTATMAATGTGTWTALGTNPAVTVITNPTSPTTTITGFTLVGTYGYVWTANGCSDTANVIIIAKPNAGPDQTTCQFSTATMAATGTGTWTALGTNPAVTVITTPASPATTISGFTVAGTYGYIWTSNGGCTDTANVIVTPKPNAGPDQSFCLPGSTSLNATGGPGLWTALATNPGASNIVSPASATTVVNGFTVGGLYSYVWTVNGCTDTVVLTVVPTNPAGPDQTICQYNPIVTAAFGTGTWVALATNPNPTTIANPAADTTSITGFSVAGTYGFTWSVSPCPDTLFVTVNAKPNAGPDQTICQNSSTVMAATGTGTWTADAGNPAVVTFVNNTSPTTSVSGFTASGTYTLYWSLNGCSDTVLITVTPKPNAGPDQTICQYSTTSMAATGTGTWTADAGNPAVVTFVNNTSPTTSVSGFTASGAYTFYWSLNGCTDTVLINITPKPNAGPDQTICQNSSTVMAATGSGTWTAAGTNPAVVGFGNNTDPATTVTGFTASGTYTLYWSLNGCSDTVLINVTAKPNAGPDQTICQYSTTSMAATGSGTWTADAGNPAVVTFVSTTDPATSVSGFTASGTYTFYWSLNGCSDTVLVNVTPKPDAGPDQTICQNSSTVMAATGSGTWTAAGTNPAVVGFGNNTDPATTVTGFTAPGTYTLYWSLNGCSDTVLINVTAKPNAGPDQTLCQYSSTVMAATGTGTWTADAGNPAVVTLVSTTDPATSVSGFNVSGTYTFYWSLNGCTDTMLINVTAKPDAGPDQNLCLPGTITTAASAGPGLWTALSSNPAATTIVSPASSSTVISGFTTGGTYSYVWTVNGCSDTMNVAIVPVSPAGPDQGTCQFTTITTAAFGTGTWTILTGNPATTTITDPASGTTTISGFDSAGTYGYVWTVNGCTDTMYVTVTGKPIAGPDQTICQYSSTSMAATGTGTWTADAGNPAVVTFVSTTDPATSVSGFTASGTYTFYWSLNGCSDTVLVNVTAKPNAGPDQTICQYSPTAMAATGTGTWTADAGNPAVVTFVSTTDPATSVSGFTASGTYTFYWSLNGCSDTVLINVTAKPDAGPDQTICQYTSTSMAASGTGTWTADAGNPAVVTFVSTTDPATSVSGFIASGTYTLYWSLNGCSDTVLVNVTAKPNAGPDQTICQYSTTAMAATGTGTWTADAGNPAVATLANTSDPATSVSGLTVSGTYTFYWSLNGCTDTMLINVTAKPNAGPDQTLCQNTTATMAAAGTGTWTADAGNPAVVTFVSTTDPATSVSGFTAPGTYLFLWTLNGCSDSMSIVVSQASTISVNSIAACIGQNDTLTATVSVPGGVFNWSPGGAITPSIIVSPATTATYTVTYTIPVCGTYTDSGTVTIYPALTLTTQNDTICNGSTATLSTTPSTSGGTYLWTPGGFTTSSITVTPNTDTVFTVTYSLPGCPITSISDTVDVTIPPTVTVNNATICFGDSTILTATPSQPGGTYSWAPGGQTTQSITVSPTSNATYTVTYAIPLSVCPPTTQTATVTVTPQPTLTVNNTTICQGQAATLTAVPSVAGGTYTWSPGGNTTAGITVSPSTTGTYTVIYTIAGCGSATDSGIITVNPSPVVTALTTQAITCYGYTNGKVAPTITPAAGTYTYQWSNAETGPIDTALAAGSYNLTITDNNGCTATAAAAAVIGAAPAPGIAEIQPGDITVLQDSMVPLTITFTYPPSAITSYSWTPSTGLSCIDCPNPIVNTGATSDTLLNYTVTISYNNGCSASAIDTIHIESGVAIGDAFTPNGDGKNDVFTITARGAREYHMTIYNRWGQLIFESYDVTLGWDGTYKGDPQPQGVYTFFVAIVNDNGKAINRVGTLTLLR